MFLREELQEYLRTVKVFPETVQKRERPAPPGDSPCAIKMAKAREARAAKKSS